MIDLGGGVRLTRQLGLLLRDGVAPHAGDHVVQKEVRLRLERVRPDHEDRVGQAVILVAVVQLADAHVAGGMDLGVVGRAIVDAAVLDLHRLEVELARAPGVLVAAGRAAMVEHRDEEVVLVVLVDHTGGHTRDEVKRILPAGRLQGAVAPDHRLGQALLLRARDVRSAVLGHARAAHRSEAGVHDAVLVGLDDEVHVAPVLPHDVVHRRRVPGVGLHLLLLGEVDAELVLRRVGPALPVHRPGVGRVAAADDAVMAGDVVFLRVCGNDRQTVDLALVSHGSLPQSTFDRRP